MADSICEIIASFDECPACKEATAAKLAANIGVWTRAGTNISYPGFVAIGKTNPASALDVNGTVTATAFKHTSDRNLKENFTGVSSREVLEKVAAMSITRWNFKGDAATPHLGPVAQDFYAAFGLGSVPVRGVRVTSVRQH